MTTDRSPTEMAGIKQAFLDGCAAQGDVAPEVAERVWQALAAFAAYGFCKAHAAAFARTAYQTAYLKRYYPAQFFCGILNNQPMGFYSSHTILQEARRLGIRPLPPDINRSEARWMVEPLRHPEGTRDCGLKGKIRNPQSTIRNCVLPTFTSRSSRRRG
jgi:error-prone DNA polymerase